MTAAAIRPDQAQRAKKIMQGQMHGTSRERITAAQMLGLYGSDTSLELLKGYINRSKQALDKEKIGSEVVQEAALALAQTRNRSGRDFLCEQVACESTRKDLRIIAIRSLSGVVTQPIINALSKALLSKDYTVVREAVNAITPFIEDDRAAHQFDITELINALYALAMYSGVPRDVSTKAYQWVIRHASDDAIDGMSKIVLKAKKSDDIMYVERVLQALVDMQCVRSRARLFQLLKRRLLKDKWYEFIAGALAVKPSDIEVKAARKLLKPTLTATLKAAVSRKFYQHLVCQQLAAKQILAGTKGNEK